MVKANHALSNSALDAITRACDVCSHHSLKLHDEWTECTERNNNNNNNNNKSLIILSLMGLFRDNETNEFKWQNNKVKNPNG